MEARVPRLELPRAGVPGRLWGVRLALSGAGAPPAGVGRCLPSDL